MLKTLIAKQLQEVFRGYFYDSKKNAARSKSGTVALFILYGFLLFVIVGGSMAALGLGLCTAFCSAGMDWMYFLIFGLLSMLLGLFGSVFSTYAGLYRAKDNDLLLAMPIPTSKIVISRLLNVYILGVLYSAIIFVPGWFVYMAMGHLTLGAIFGGFLMYLEISLLVMLLSCLLGWVVAKISAKIKNKSIVATLTALLGIAVYYVVYFKAQVLIRDMAENAAAYGGKIKGAARILAAWGEVGVGNPLPMAVSFAGIVILLGLTWLLLCRTFLKIATTSDAVGKFTYREKTQKTKSVPAAMLAKEFGRFTSSANYMLNCGLGTVMVPALGVLLAIKGATMVASIRAAVGAWVGLIALGLACAVCLASAMNLTAAPSVSLEGKNLWIAQSMPIHPWYALQAKWRVQLLLTGTAILICDACIAFAVSISVWDKLLLTALTLAYTVFSSGITLVFGLKMANLTWTDEIKPIKSSGAVGLSLLVGWVCPIATFGVGLALSFFLPTWVVMLAFTVLYAALGCLIGKWMKNRGAQLFAAL